MQSNAKSSITPRAGPPPGYTVHEGFPPLPEYLDLRKLSGLTPVTSEQGALVPSGSWFGVYITADAEEDTIVDGQSSSNGTATDPGNTHHRKAVAMGRIIGDGGWYFCIADMAVLPDHQRKGLGDVIIKKLIERIDSHAAKGQAYVTLAADGPGRRLYERNGFTESMPHSMGMKRLMQVGGKGGGVSEETVTTPE